MIVQHVRPGCESLYREWSRKINSVCSTFPGFVDLEVFEPADEIDRFVIVVRFATEEQSRAWHDSETCRGLLEEARPLLEERVLHGPSSVFGSWFSSEVTAGPEREPPQNWKEALVVLLVLYPTVMLLSLFVTGPLLSGWSMSTSMYVGNLLCVALMTWLLMPFVTGQLAFWLRPLKGSGPGVRYGGLALVLGSQLLMVALFHHVLSP